MTTATAPRPFPVAAGTRLLGEVISWTCSGVSVTHAALVAALADAALDEGVARNSPRGTRSPGRARSSATSGSSARWPRTRRA